MPDLCERMPDQRYKQPPHREAYYEGEHPGPWGRISQAANMSAVRVPDCAIGLACDDRWRSREILTFELGHSCPLPNRVMLARELNESVNGMFQLWTLPGDNEQLANPIGCFASPRLSAGRSLQYPLVSEILVDFERSTCDFCTGWASP
jgi:hypothetical protein